MLGATLRRDEVGAGGEPWQKRRGAPVGMREALPGEKVPLEGVRCVSHQGAGHGPLGGGEPRLPAPLLLLQPAPHALPVGQPGRGGDVGPQGRPRWPSAHIRMGLRGRALDTKAGTGARQAVRTGAALAARVPGSVGRAGRRPWPRRPPGTRVRRRGPGLSQPSGRGRRAVPPRRRLRTGGDPGLRGLPPWPQPAAPDQRRPIDRGSEPAPGLCLRPARDGPGQPGALTRRPSRTAQAREERGRPRAPASGRRGGPRASCAPAGRLER
jgi:hypothetical protein